MQLNVVKKVRKVVFGGSFLALPGVAESAELQLLVEKGEKKRKVHLECGCAAHQLALLLLLLCVIHYSFCRENPQPFQMFSLLDEICEGGSFQSLTIH